MLAIAILAICTEQDGCASENGLCDATVTCKCMCVCARMSESTSVSKHANQFRMLIDAWP